MVGSDIEDFRSRWTSELLTAGVRSLHGKEESPFGNVTDRIRDLRGLLITQPVKSIQIDDADLTGCAVQGFGQFGYCHFARCSFCEAMLTTNLGDNFQDCDFTNANLSGGVIRGRFTDCDFTATNLSSTMGTEIKFVRCKFVKTNFRKATLTHCSFEECLFLENKCRNGSLAYSKFLRSPIDPATLGNTLMEKVVVAE